MDREKLPTAVPTDSDSLIPPGDDRRVEALRALDILDTPNEERYDQLIRELAARLGAPVAYLAFIDKDRQWIKSKVGPIPQEIKREHAFCSRTILGSSSLVVEDASRDPRFSSSPLVTDGPEFRFYAGVPSADAAGQVVGTVCVAGPEARKLSPRELVILEGFAKRVASEVNAKPMVLAAYATEDAEWMRRLLQFGGALEEQGLMDLWPSHRLDSEGSSSWKLKDSLFHAKKVLLLISDAFLRSKFVGDDGFQLLLGIREMEKLTTLPVLIEPCDWKAVPWLAERVAWPPEGTPLSAVAAESLDGFLSELR